MESVTAHATAAREATAPDEARAHLTEAAALTRQAAEQIRQAVAEQLVETWSPPRHRGRLDWADTGADRAQARAAADRERQRVAQDSHDLLGLGLAAVALKCDLAARLIGRDDTRARAELDALIRLATQTHSDMQTVTTGSADLSLPAELASAHHLLTSTGVTVEVHPATVELPDQAAALLATVLREAVTNVLRHARATRCDIHLLPDLGGIRLKVTNDGVLPTRDRPEPSGGRGLPNLNARATAMGGRVVTRSGGNHFDVTIRIPLPPSDPTFLGSNPNRVHPVPRP
jgi:signal transduction histidine kinase